VLAGVTDIKMSRSRRGVSSPLQREPNCWNQRSSALSGPLRHRGQPGRISSRDCSSSRGTELLFSYKNIHKLSRRYGGRDNVNVANVGRTALLRRSRPSYGEQVCSGADTAARGGT